MGATQTTVSAALKEHYAKNVAQVLWNDEAVTPLLGIMEKRSGSVDASGRKFVQPIHYGDGSAVSADFATAQAKAQGATTGSANQYTRWEVPAVTQNGVAYFDREIINAIQSTSQMFDLGQGEIDGRLRAMRNRLAIQIHGDGYGAIGTISAISGTGFTISTDRCNRLQAGDDLVASATNGGGVLKSATAVTVTGINEDNGVITVSADPTALTWANNDFIFFKGDRENAASPTQKCIFGHAGWVPSAAPTSALWCNVNRLGVWQLGGLRMSLTGLTIKLGLIKLINRLFKYGRTRCSHAIISAEDWATLSDTVDGQKHMDVKAREYNIAYDAISLMGTMIGTVPILPDPYMLKGEALAGDFATEGNAYLMHSGDLLNIDDHDGNVFLRSATATAYETRMYMYGNAVWAAPGKFAKGTLLGL